MANTNVQRKVEDWVRKEWMKKFYGKNFYRDRIKLSSGGVFEFDAVSQDGDIIASISTSSAITATGRRAAGPLHIILNNDKHREKNNYIYRAESL